MLIACSCLLGTITSLKMPLQVGSTLGINTISTKKLSTIAPLAILTHKVPLQVTHPCNNISAEEEQLDVCLRPLQKEKEAGLTEGEPSPPHNYVCHESHRDRQNWI